MVSFTLPKVCISLACLLIISLSLSTACNDVVCGPIVTKCQLLKSCNCDVPEGKSTEDCPCCATCAACLQDKYPVCCSCVGKSHSVGILAPSIYIAYHSVSS